MDFLLIIMDDTWIEMLRSGGGNHATFVHQQDAMVGAFGALPPLPIQMGGSSQGRWQRCGRLLGLQIQSR